MSNGGHEDNRSHEQVESRRFDNGLIAHLPAELIRHIKENRFSPTNQLSPLRISTDG
jgi:hypothetical protein